MSKAHKSRRFVYQLEALLKVRGIRKKQEHDKFKKAEQKVKDELQKEEALIAQEQIEIEFK